MNTLKAISKVATTETALDRSLMSSPGAKALRGPDGRWITRGELHRDLKTIRESAAKAGLRNGHVVATLMPDTVLTGEIVLALCGEMSVFPLNPALTDGETSELLRAARVSALIGQPNDPIAARCVQEVGIPFIQSADLLDPEAIAPQPIQLNGDHRPGLLLSTSGSTGTPKRVAVSVQAMEASARAISQALELGPSDRAVLALPMYHIGALVDLLLAPLLSGGSAVITPDRSGPSLIRSLSDDQPTWIQLVPSMLTSLMRECKLRPDAKRPCLRFVRSVSASLPAGQQDQAKEQLGCPVIQMYGMTETAGQICSNPLPPLPRKPGSVGLPAGPELRIMDAEGHALTAGHTGEVCVRGPSVFAGYEDWPNDDLFRGDWFRTGDLGMLDADGYLFLQGRLKEMINSGGEKISAFEVEDATMSLPGVLQAAAYALPHASMGEQVGLSIVATDDVNEALVLSHLRQKLAGFKCPRNVQFLEQLPLLGTSKINKLKLAEDRSTALVGGEPPPALSGHPQEIAEIWARCLETCLPGPNTDFFDAGGDSLSATAFLLAIESWMGSDVSSNLLYDHPQFQDLCHVLCQQKDEQDQAGGDSATAKTDPRVAYAHRHMAGWLGEVAPPGGVIRCNAPHLPKEPVFWICQDSVEVSNFSDFLGNNRPVYAMKSLVMYPDRNEADRQSIARHYADEIMQIRPSGALVLGGFCEGASLMELVAECLEQKGRAIRVFISVELPKANKLPSGAFANE